MQVYRLQPGSDIAGLELRDEAAPSLAPHQVRVRVRAVALNFRDLMVARGTYLASDGQSLIPGSDAAGEVIEIGAAVTRWRVGDRVASTFFPYWQDGAPTAAKTRAAPGAAADGVLAEQIVWGEDQLVGVPTHLDWHEAATLTCAGVTAWNALFVEGRLKPGASVLLLGTGGVSIWGLQLAHAAGVRTIVTSSSDAKLERARQLGASATINYRATPEWQEEVLRLTNGAGVDAVLEVGGQGTLTRSVASTGMGGTVAIIGGVSGFGGELEPFALIGGARRLSGIFVGSHAMHHDLNRLVTQADIHPVIDRVFAFDQAREAYAHLASGAHFGKVVIGV
ncbi:zinc-dependent alcohol dehydrogenase family protein [Chitiniphilus eburneus]|uniref:NAD(P)-dependent alcohol dehydrogenase n=1 Tax=Chitiniphilus eburneus TaxID=2571148 RepID=A0A4U0PKJ4_9NEIS|nr:NAD(P)-dependent alcohol dehydrogenase [Chitiniphilus eburneus]TJZ68621.1 NAD(P)-dependent alcohol dehydrogenase [Chitiniphilus eburneus]